jgi:hypothetical protein
LLVSAPALAAALRTVDQLSGGAFQPVLRLDELVTMYRIEPGAGEVASALHVISDVGERLRRLGAAYGEWQRFEPEPYFDLRPHQAAELLHISERVATVHAACFFDALLPSFQAALAYFLDDFVPARRAGAAALETAVMVEKWLQLTAVLRSVRTALANDAAFLSMNATGEERSRWQAYWRALPPAGMPAVLLPELAQTPSLTLAVTFPLPAFRQPGRLRRLRRAWTSGHNRRRATRTPGQS